LTKRKNEKNSKPLKGIIYWGFEKENKYILTKTFPFRGNKRGSYVLIRL